MLPSFVNGSSVCMHAYVYVLWYVNNICFQKWYMTHDMCVGLRKIQSILARSVKCMLRQQGMMRMAQLALADAAAVSEQFCVHTNGP